MSNIQGQQKHAEGEAGAKAEAVGATCKGSGSRRSNMQGQQKQKEQHAWAE
jgi:hypothetical protein